MVSIAAVVIGIGVLWFLSGVKDREEYTELHSDGDV